MRIQRVIVIQKRIQKLRASFKLDTQQLRYNLINRLTELFNAASHLAKSRDLELPDRQEWTRVAAYIAQTIESVSNLFKALGFSDVGSGVDVFTLLRELMFSDLGSERILWL